MPRAAPYYRASLALVHHEGFGAHPEACAPGVLDLLAPVRSRGGVVLEIGCGSGRLTRHLTDAGLPVIATDASPPMLDLARAHAPDAEIRALSLPDDVPPEADAVVSVGHVLNYLDDEDAIRRALAALAGCLRPGGLLVLDLCDLSWGRIRQSAPNYSAVGDGWAIITRFATPGPDRFVREMTTFVRDSGGLWQRDDERHDNVLLDTAAVPGWLAEYGVRAEIRPSFGSERLPDGLVALVGEKAGIPGDLAAGPAGQAR